MSGVNKAIILGRLGKDPESRNTQDGRLIVNLSIATSEKWRDKNSGEYKERTEWHRVSIFNEGLAKIAQQYLKKGSQVYVEGQIQTRKWTDQQGVERYSTEIVLGPYRSALNLIGDNKRNDDYGGDGGGSSSSRSGSTRNDLDDDIPF